MFVYVYTEQGRKSGIIRLGQPCDNNNIQPVDILMALVKTRVPRADPFQ